jgi:CubicO group peptidase (beta-lactamase class C family)
VRPLKHIAKIVTACATLMLVPGIATARPAPLPTDVERLARQTMADTGARGIAIAIIDRGKVQSVQSFGERNAKGEPLTPDTIMYGASLTKAVFGYWTAMQVGKGGVNLDKPVAVMLVKPLPDYGNLDAYGNWGDLQGDDRWQAITPRHILNHSTGFANFSFLEPDGKLKFHFSPGARYGYSGEGMMLLQFAFEAGQGRSVGEEIERDLFKPLGMTNTSLMWRADFAANLADGWTADGSVEPHDERSRVRAAGSMDTSITDMAKMAAAMVRGWGLSPRLHRGFTHGTLTITTRSQFPSLQAEAPAAQWPGAKAGLGVITFNGPQGPGYFKGGHNDSTANMMVCLTKRQRCIVILSNDVRSERKFPALVEALMGPTGTPWRWEYPDADY